MENPKVAIVTGSNCGLGLATATSLWKDHNCHVIIACRDEKKAKDAMKSICGSEGHERLEFIPLDLSSLESVNKFAEDFNAKHKHLDILINNAGVFASKLEKTGDGFEKMFQVNYLGHFLLTNRLLGAMQRSSNVARIINIGSNAYKFAQPAAVDEIPVKVEKEKSLWTMTSLKLYGSSKLCNLWFSMALKKKLEEQGFNRITIATMHPGAVRTELGREGSSFMKPIMNVVYKLFFILPVEAAKPTVRVAMAQNTDLTSGQYWDTNKVVPITKQADSLPSAMKLWDKSVEMLASKGYTL